MRGGLPGSMNPQQMDNMMLQQQMMLNQMMSNQMMSSNMMQMAGNMPAQGMMGNTMGMMGNPSMMPATPQQMMMANYSGTGQNFPNPGMSAFGGQTGMNRGQYCMSQGQYTQVASNMSGPFQPVPAPQKTTAPKSILKKTQQNFDHVPISKPKSSTQTRQGPSQTSYVRSERSSLDSTRATSASTNVTTAAPKTSKPMSQQVSQVTKSASHTTVAAPTVHVAQRTEQALRPTPITQKSRESAVSAATISQPLQSSSQKSEEPVGKIIPTLVSNVRKVKEQPLKRKPEVGPAYDLSAEKIPRLGPGQVKFGLIHIFFSL